MSENGDGIERSRLTEQVRLILSDEIATGILKQGQLFTEKEIAERFGISRTPVREAFRLLVKARLIEMRPRRGAVVTGVTPDQVINMFEMAAELESICVRLATHRMTPLEYGRLRQLHDNSAAIIESDDVDAFDAYNSAFHEAICHGTHNPFMARYAIELRFQLAAFRRTQLRNDGRLARAREEHDDVMNAITRGDGEEAAQLMRVHMLNAAGALELYLKGQREGQ